MGFCWGWPRDGESVGGRGYSWLIRVCRFGHKSGAYGRPVVVPPPLGTEPHTPYTHPRPGDPESGIGSSENGVSRCIFVYLAALSSDPWHTTS